MVDHISLHDGEALGLLRAAESQWNSAKDDDSRPVTKLDMPLKAYRDACESVSLNDPLLAYRSDVDNHLWIAHNEINKRFQKAINEIKAGPEGKPVETRKLTKEYLSFLKGSQRFYRQYILRLDERAGGFSSLSRIAQQWKREGDKQSSAANLTDNARSKIADACYMSLVRLGDLSRYRESGFATAKLPDWSHATGYYDLAVSFNPRFGLAWHQQAIISRLDGSQLRATYFLYRALCATRPLPGSDKDSGSSWYKNLQVNFKKIIKSVERRDPINAPDSPESKGARSALKTWFVRFIAKCFQGEESAKRKELEDEVLVQLPLQIKERPVESDLQRFVLIAMAAEFVASRQIEHGDTSASMLKSYVFFLVLNTQLLLLLLNTLASELERLADEDSRADIEGPQALSDRITVVSRRVLPPIWLYSIWILSRSHLIGAIPGSVPDFDVASLWNTYTRVLTLLVRLFPLNSLPTIDYMLEEEVDTIGFGPLDKSNERIGVYHKDGRYRQQFSDPGVGRLHPSEEMLARILHIIKAGVHLGNVEGSPVEIDAHDRFVYKLHGPQTLPNIVPQDPAIQHEIPKAKTARTTSAELSNTFHENGSSRSLPPASDVNSISRDDAMSRMVDELVDPEPTPEITLELNEGIPPTPPEQTFEDTATSGDGTFSPVRVTAQQLIERFGFSTPPTSGGRHQKFASVSATSPVAMSPLPRLPNQSDIWAPNTRNSGSVPPSTPTPNQWIETQRPGDSYDSSMAPQHSLKSTGASQPHSQLHTRNTSLGAPVTGDFGAPNPTIWSSATNTPMVGYGLSGPRDQYKDAWNGQNAFIQNGSGGQSSTWAYGGTSFEPNQVHNEWERPGLADNHQLPTPERWARGASTPLSGQGRWQYQPRSPLTEAPTASTSQGVLWHQEIHAGSSKSQPRQAG